MKFDMLKTVGSFIILLSFFNVVQAQKNQSEPLHQIFNDEWQARMERFPELAQSMGDKSKADQLSDVSEAAQQQWLKTTKAFLVQLEKTEFDSLSNGDKINYQIFKQQLLNRAEELSFKVYQIPFLADSGFHTSIARLPVRSEERRVGKEC